MESMKSANMLIGRCILLSSAVMAAVVGCDTSTPTPMTCRVLNVAVEDHDTVTGTIVESIEVDTEEEAKVKCRKPFTEHVRGCTIALSDGNYMIVHMDGDSRVHEECHALYEEWRHVEVR